jgi:predicted phage terminase large subunit-like protein
MGSYPYAGQYQQRPAPREGGMFKRRWFEIVRAAPVRGRRVRSWDLAASVEKGDWTVGLLMSRAEDGVFYIEDVQRMRASAREVEIAMKNCAGQDGRAATIRIPEDPGQAGKAQAEHLIRELAGYAIFAERETGAKEVRAMPFAAQCEAGNVKIVEAPWNAAFLDEIENFPMGAHDDQVDGAAGAFNRLAATPGPMVFSPEFLRRAAQPVGRRA